MANQVRPQSLDCAVSCRGNLCLHTVHLVCFGSKVGSIVLSPTFSLAWDRFEHLQADPETQIWRIARFLNLDVTEEMVAQILARSSKEWMAAHVEKFDGEHCVRCQPTVGTKWQLPLDWCLLLL